MQRHRNLLTIACLLAMIMAAIGEARAQADTYPGRPVRIISDSAPGSAVDVGLRIIADGLSQHWGQQVLVVNQPGAGGAISARVAAEAAPDGYTLYAPALSVFLAVPGKAPNLPLELPRDFTPVGFTADQPMAIGASPALGVASLPDLIALAKKRPDEISYAVTGIGRLTHLTGELLQLRAGIKLQMVPYSGGSQALSDVMSGRVPVVIEGYTGLAGAFQSGSLKALAVASAERLPVVPDLPTVAETLPGFVASGWQAVVAPRGTPEAIVNKASEDLRKVLSQPEYRDRLAARGSYARPMSSAEVTAFVRDQQRMWKPALDRIANLPQ
jgi:tripartite-type tricarboxylate transporter receptor subunit TctC